MEFFRTSNRRVGNFGLVERDNHGEETDTETSEESTSHEV